MGDGSCTGSSQMAVLIQTVRRDCSEALSLHAAVLHTAVLHAAVFLSKIVHAYPHTTHTSYPSVWRLLFQGF